MTRVFNEGAGAFNQHYPKIAAIVTAQANGRENAMTVDWHTALSFRPPLYGICIVPGRFTYQLITDSQEFGVNFMPFEMVDLVHRVGSTGGQQVDKFRTFNIACEQPRKTKVPILQAAYAAYECKLIDDRSCGDHNLLVGEIVAVHLLKEAFTRQEMLDLNKVSPVLYLGEELYVTSSAGTLRDLENTTG